MICHWSQIGRLYSTLPLQQQQQWQVCRRSAEKARQTATHTHTNTRYRMVGQKRDNCSQCATGLAVLLENPGGLGLILLPLHSLCLPQPASMQGCPRVAQLLFHTHAHKKTFIPYQKRKAALSLLKQSHIATSAVFRPVKGTVTLTSRERTAAAQGTRRSPSCGEPD